MKEGETQMHSHAEHRLRLANECRAREFREADARRLARRALPVRRSIRQSIAMIGQRLTSDPTRGIAWPAIDRLQHGEIG